MPAAQLPQRAESAAPVTLCVVPPGHATHSAAAAADWYCPTGQPAQKAAPAPAKVPEAHGAQLAEVKLPVSGLAVPAGQPTQPLIPLLD